MTTVDQSTFQNRVNRYSSIRPPVQGRPDPGLDHDLVPQTGRDEGSYRGTGRLAGHKALITGSNSAIGAGVAIGCAKERVDVAF